MAIGRYRVWIKVTTGVALAALVGLHAHASRREPAEIIYKTPKEHPDDSPTVIVRPPALSQGAPQDLLGGPAYGAPAAPGQSDPFAMTPAPRPSPAPLTPIGSDGRAVLPPGSKVRPGVVTADRTIPADADTLELRRRGVTPEGEDIARGGGLMAQGGFESGPRIADERAEPLQLPDELAPRFAIPEPRKISPKGPRELFSVSEGALALEGAPASGRDLAASGYGLIEVLPGDTLYSFARAAGVSVEALAAVNGLSPPYTLRVGETLILPPAGAGYPRAAATADPVTQVAQQTAGDGLHVVGQGETVYSIARRYNVDLESFIAMNGLAAPYTIGIGQTLRWSADAPRTAPQPVAQKLVQPPTALSFLEWPLEAVIRSPEAEGPALYLHGEAGAQVRAAAEGVVVYEGPQLRGDGRLVLIQHGDGWVTSYAGLAESLVGLGDAAVQGQPIGRLGASGGSGATLRFEVRKDGVSLDPAANLR